jgi:DNA adenine methylase
MRYPGGKGKTYQHVVNLMPPHSVYIETHLGGGAVLRNKKPSARSIAIDADERVIDQWKTSAGERVELVHGRAEDFLAAYPFTGEELIYCDPPYHPATRRQARVYRHDYSEADHVALLEILIKLPCKVLLSGYAHPLYEELLQGWGCRKFEAATHKGNREETLWFNFAPPLCLHDARFLGANFRERQSTKRRLQRLQTKVDTMDPVERVVFMQWLRSSYPLEQGAML